MDFVHYLDYVGWEDSYEKMIASAEKLYKYERENKQLKNLEEKESV